MNAPLAQAEPHPDIEGAWTIRDPGRLVNAYKPMFASRASAEIAASKRNEQRRQQK